jgi:cysteine synthase
MQYNNPGNPAAHYDGTAEEILAQCEGKYRFSFSFLSVYC